MTKSVDSYADDILIFDGKPFDEKSFLMDTEENCERKESRTKETNQSSWGFKLGCSSEVPTLLNWEKNILSLLRNATKDGYLRESVYN